MDTRLKQINKEAKLSLLLTQGYLITWIITAYFLDDKPGILGLPCWFEASCLFLPLAFILICWLIVKSKFVTISLNPPEKN